MGGVPKKHHSKSKVGRRRSQLGIKKQKLQVCESCQSPILPHRACAHCGHYSKTSRQKTKEKRET